MKIICCNAAEYRTDERSESESAECGSYLISQTGRVDWRRTLLLIAGWLADQMNDERYG